MDSKFTEKLGEWLKQPPAARDWSAGALMLLQLSGNQILYRNVMAHLDSRHDVIEYQLQKYYNFRVRELTHEQVSAMAEKVEEIVTRNIPLAMEADSQRRGRREDHDSLPPKIQKLWDNNLKLLNRLRELHVRLRDMTLKDVPCPDSERYPYLKEMISVDKKIRANYKAYDSYA